MHARHAWAHVQIDNVHTTDDLASQLAFGDVVDLSRRDLAIANGDPASRPGVRATASKEVVSDHLHITTWVLCASPDATCWDLAQGGATLRAATLLLPPNGQLHVLNADAAGGWDNVTVKGALLRARPCGCVAAAHVRRGAQPWDVMIRRDRFTCVVGAVMRIRFAVPHLR